MSSPSASDALLEIQNLKKYFPVKSGLFSRQKVSVHAVDEVSLTVKPGQTLGIVGESGCGKSTLGKTIIKLYEPDSGKILFQQTDVTNLSTKQFREFRQDIQIVFQDPFSSLNPRMTIQDILSEPFDIHNIYTDKKEKNEKIVELIEEIGLTAQDLDRYPHEFSGGQLQRIGIARAIALKPKLVICDEPVSALDVSIQSQILNLLMDLRDKYGLGYIFIAHDLAVIEHISDDVAVMYLGQIVEYTTKQQLFEDPKHPYTKALLESIPSFQNVGQKNIKALAGEIPSPTNPPQGCRFHTRCPMAQERCRKEAPQLEQKKENGGKEHLARCFLVD